MLYKPLHEINEADLQALVDNGVREDNSLDYKLALSSTNDDGKKEFLKDVVAMANTNGGDIIYGIREDRSGTESSATAAEVTGVAGVNVDSTKLLMEQLIQSSIEPRLQGVGIHTVTLNSGAVVFILRIPRSWNAPHVVRFKNHWRFYGRHSAGVYEMDITQVRDAFLANASIPDKLESFRERRLNSLFTNVRERRPALVIHLQPFESVRPGAIFDLQSINPHDRVVLLGSVQHTEGVVRFNFDGLYVYMEHSPDRAYLQVYKNGVTEEVYRDSVIHQERTEEGNISYLDVRELERIVIRGVGRRLELLKKLGITSPVLVQVSLIRVSGLKLKVLNLDSMRDLSYIDDLTERHSIDRDMLLCSPILVENLQELQLEGTVRKGDSACDSSFDVAGKILRPVFDSIWNAAGLARSLHYDSAGNWTGRIS